MLGLLGVFRASQCCIIRVLAKRLHEWCKLYSADAGGSTALPPRRRRPSTLGRVLRAQGAKSLPPDMIIAMPVISLSRSSGAGHIPVCSRAAPGEQHEAVPRRGGLYAPSQVGGCRSMRYDRFSFVD